MRIVVSGTHATGKSTLAADLRAALPGYALLEDPWDLVADDLEPASASSFVEQLHLAADRLLELGPGTTSSSSAAPSTCSPTSTPCASWADPRRPRRRWSRCVR